MASTDASGSLEKAIEILFHLHAQPGRCGRERDRPGARDAEVERAPACSRRSRVGIWSSGTRGRQYRTGMGLVALGLGALEREPLLAWRRGPCSRPKRAEIGDTVFLVAAARAGRLLVLDKAEGNGFLRAAPQVGAEVPVHATAVGKLFLAFGGDAVSVPDGALERFTGQTASTSGALLADVGRAREQGFAINRGEWIAGLAVAAAPVEVRGALHAAVAVGTTAERLEEIGASVLAARMLAAGRRIAMRLAGESPADAA